MSTVREIHIGVVTDRGDPEKRGRLKIACASLLGVDDNDVAVEFGDWVEPSFPALMDDGGGFFAIPSVGVTIEIEVSSGADHDESPGQTFLTNPDPRWKASLLQEGGAIGEEFQTNYPDRMGFRSASGHILFFDDSPGADGRVVLQQRPNAEGAASFLAVDGDGSIQIITSAGQMIFLNTETGEITILDKAKNMIAMKADGITIVDGVNGHSVNFGEQGVQVLAAGPLILQGGAVILGDPKTAAATPVAVMVAGTPTPSTKVFAAL